MAHSLWPEDRISKRMLADWSVECSGDDPALVVPWQASEPVASLSPNSDPWQLAPTVPGPASESAASSVPLAGFVDLRENPYDLDQIPEAELYPPLMQALRALNAPRSAVFTAKCDAWTLNPEEVDQLRQHLDIAEDSHETTATGFASYIDLVWRDRSIFASFHQSEQLLHRLARLSAPIDEPHAMLDCVLRPAMIDLTSPHEGFAISLYVKALGPDLYTAKQVWASALEAVVALLRSKDIAIG